MDEDGFNVVRCLSRSSKLSIVDNKDVSVGVITSGSISLSLGKSIALGYISSDLSLLDSEIYISIRNKNIKAKVVSIPFVKWEI